jgi:hypothetical protein
MMKLQKPPKFRFLAKPLLYCGIAALTAVLADGFENGFANGLLKDGGRVRLERRCPSRTESKVTA